jgi:hypothetical protein
MDFSRGGELKYLELIERGVVALEKLNEEVQVEIDPGPPICPHCGSEDPEVQCMEGASTGPLSEIVIEAKCMECDNMLYAVIESYSMHRTSETVKDELFYERRRAGKEWQHNAAMKS